MEEDEGESESLEGLSVIFGGAYCVASDRDSSAVRRGGDCGRGCSGVFELEWVNVDRNAFRARTWRLASSEAPSGFTGREKFTFLGMADGVRPANNRASGVGIDSTFPCSGS